MKTDPNAPPKRLSKTAKQIWRRVLADFHMDDAAGRAILQTGLEAYDRMKLAQQEVREHGVVIETRLGDRKANPALAIERDARNGFLAAFRLLRLDPGAAS